MTTMDDISRAITPGDAIETEKVKGADGALAFASIESLDLDEKTRKKLLWKIDIHVLPWLCGLYILQYLDKAVVNYSSVMGILTDANLTSDQFSWLGSIFFFGSIVALAPHNRLLQHFTPSKYVAFCMVSWGIVLCTMAACRSFVGLMIQRFFLGIFEAVVNCAFVLITSAWYRKHEHATRVMVWSACNGLATVIGAVVAYGCLAGLEIHPSSLGGWQILALSFGSVSIVYGACMWYFMAGSIITAEFFTAEEKALAIESLKDNQQGIGSHIFKWYQVWEAFTDIRTWLYVCFILCAQIPNGGINLLSSLLIKSLGFNSKTTLLLSIPGGGLQFIFQLVLGPVADRTRQRLLTSASIQLVAIFGAGLLIGLGNVGALYNRNGQLVAYFLMIGSCAISFYFVVALIASNVLGTTKKVTTNVLVFVAVAASYIIGPQMFRDPPYYFHAKYATLALWASAFLLLFVIRTLNIWENNKRDKEWEATGFPPAPPGNEFLDQTDKENKYFRYVI